MSLSKNHPLFVPGAPVTEKIRTWTIKEYPYEVIGVARGFEVRIYHYQAKNFLPYLIVEIAQNTGWILGADAAATEQVARETANEMLEDIGATSINRR